MIPIRSALVTGATGFVGSALARHLVAENVEVTCIVRDAGKAHAALGDAPNLTLTNVAAWAEESLQRALSGQSFDVVFHLASYGVHSHERNPDALVEGNTGILIALLKAISHRKIRRFVFAGSCAEYGFAAHDNSPIEETQPLRPTSPYGAAKARAEEQGAKLARELEVPFVAVRLFNIFGPGEAPQRLLPFIIDHLYRGKPAELTGGEQVRDFVYLDDAVDALLAAATADLQPGEAYNVCSAQGTTVRQMGELAADEMRKSRSLLLWGARPYRSDEPMWLVGDNRRFTQATSWRPTISLAEGIRRMIAAVEHISTTERQHAL